MKHVDTHELIYEKQVGLISVSDQKAGRISPVLRLIVVSSHRRTGRQLYITQHGDC